MMIESDNHHNLPLVKISLTRKITCGYQSLVIWHKSPTFDLQPLIKVLIASIAVSSLFILLQTRKFEKSALTLRTFFIHQNLTSVDIRF